MVISPAPDEHPQGVMPMARTLTAVRQSGKRRHPTIHRGEDETDEPEPPRDPLRTRLKTLVQGNSATGKGDDRAHQEGTAAAQGWPIVRSADGPGGGVPRPLLLAIAPSRSAAGRSFSSCRDRHARRTAGRQALREVVPPASARTRAAGGGGPLRDLPGAAAWSCPHAEDIAHMGHVTRLPAESSGALCGWSSRNRSG